VTSRQERGGRYLLCRLPALVARWVCRPSERKRRTEEERQRGCSQSEVLAFGSREQARHEKKARYNDCILCKLTDSMRDICYNTKSACRSPSRAARMLVVFEMRRPHLATPSHSRASSPSDDRPQSRYHDNRDSRTRGCGRATLHAPLPVAGGRSQNSSSGRDSDAHSVCLV
jgi:hypothetical protein